MTRLKATIAVAGPYEKFAPEAAASLLGTAVTDENGEPIAVIVDVAVVDDGARVEATLDTLPSGHIDSNPDSRPA